MHLTLSNFKLEQLMAAAHNKRLEGYESIDLTAYWIAPDQEVEIFDRILNSSLDSRYYVMAEYAGEEPRYHSDGRRYRRRFNNPLAAPTGPITIASSRYRMRPLSAVLQTKRDGHGDDLQAITFKVIVCDFDNRNGIQAFCEEDLSLLEESEVLELPFQHEQVKVHA